MRELLVNNSLFVTQLYEDKSLALHTRDLIFFTTDLQTVNYYTIHYRRMAENGFAPPLGNFADISYLVEN